LSSGCVEILLDGLSTELVAAAEINLAFARRLPAGSVVG
jgi:hypothetical protein